MFGEGVWVEKECNGKGSVGEGVAAVWRIISTFMVVNVLAIHRL